MNNLRKHLFIDWLSWGVVTYDQIELVLLVLYLLSRKFLRMVLYLSEVRLRRNSLGDEMDTSSEGRLFQSLRVLLMTKSPRGLESALFWKIAKSWLLYGSDLNVKKSLCESGLSLSWHSLWIKQRSFCIMWYGGTN